MKLIALVLIFILNPSIAIAAFTDGNELYQWMLENEKDSSAVLDKGSAFKIGLFNGYVNGVVDTSNHILFCTTSGVTRAQLVAITAKYLKNNPNEWNKPAHSIVVFAMQESFPCKK